MAEHIYEMANEFNLPNITVYKWLNNGVFVGWKIEANNNYVFYDPNDNSTGIDQVTGETIFVTYYHKTAYLPKNYNFNKFSWIAVNENEVDKNYIV